MLLHSFFFALVVGLATARGAFAGDWPEILGPTRSGRAESEQLASDWTEKPTQVWKKKVGEGYAGPAVVGNRVFLFHRENGNDVLDCLGAQDGSRQWRLQWPSRYRGGIDSDRGPRCVPVVRDGHVLVLSAAGELHCADVGGVSVGPAIWRRISVHWMVISVSGAHLW